MSRELLRKLRERSTNYLSKGDVWTDPDAEATWPTLYSFLALSLDGAVKRDPSKITIYVHQGNVMACLRCPTEGQVCHLKVDPSDCLFDLLETHLAAGKADWRDMPKNGRR